MKRIIQTTALTVAGLLVILLALEGMIRLYGALRTQYSSGSPALFIPDPRLGHKPNSLYPGHDASGWRNARVPGHAEIVALGDSQTYGLNVEMEDAWPQAVGKLLGVPVYQMAFGGYGPVHYAQLKRRIEMADTLPALESMIARGDNPYKLAVNAPRVDGDGHPVKEGYHAIAVTIARQIKPGSFVHIDSASQ